MQECIFYKVTELVELLIVFALDDAVSFRRNYWLHALILGPLKNGIGIVALVSEKRFGGESFNQAGCLSAICCCTLCNNSPDRHTMRIHGEMQFCVEPPFVRLMS